MQERTAELDRLNARLRSEVLGHQQAEKARQELQRRLVNAQEDERSRISRELHDEVGQQITALMLALKALDDVVRRFPESKYARDAKLKLDFTRDHLAGKEMEIGRYYLKRQEYLAAMNRFKRVVDNYQTTTHIPEALERLV